MDFLISLIVSLIAPRAPAYVKTIISSTLPLVFELTKDITEMVQKAGLDKRDVRVIARQVRNILDETLDTIPGWSDLSEDERDHVLRTLEIVTVWVADMADKDDDGKVTPAQLRVAANKVRRGFRKAAGTQATVKQFRDRLDLRRPSGE